MEVIKAAELGIDIAPRTVTFTLASRRSAKPVIKVADTG